MCHCRCDGLVVPGKYPPDVVGTPDFIAPEVVMTSGLAKDNPQRKLPRRETDQHALAVLIYMYLFCIATAWRSVHDVNDEQRDEALTMGEKALFVEHPTDRINRIKVADAKPTELPWADTEKIPYTITGPYLSPLFLQAFVAGLHDPGMRPSANDWETALVKTVDLDPAMPEQGLCTEVVCVRQHNKASLPFLRYVPQRQASYSKSILLKKGGKLSPRQS